MADLFQVSQIKWGHDVKNPERLKIHVSKRTTKMEMLPFAFCLFLKQ